MVSPWATLILHFVTWHLQTGPGSICYIEARGINHDAHEGAFFFCYVLFYLIGDLLFMWGLHLIIIIIIIGMVFPLPYFIFYYFLTVCHRRCCFLFFLFSDSNQEPDELFFNEPHPNDVSERSRSHSPSSESPTYQPCVSG